MKFCYHNWHVHKTEKFDSLFRDLTDWRLEPPGFIVGNLFAFLCVAIGGTVLFMGAALLGYGLEFVDFCTRWAGIAGKAIMAIECAYFVISIIATSLGISIKHDRTCLKCNKLDLTLTKFKTKKSQEAQAIRLSQVEIKKKIEKAEESYQKSLKMFKIAHGR